MKEIIPGDIVTRRSYGGDIFFRVEAIEHSLGYTNAMLRGLYYRLCADAPLEDLEKKKQLEINALREEHGKKQNQVVMRTMRSQGRDYQPRLQFSRKELRGKNFFELPGKVLHLDGDEGYRSVCHQRYLQMGVPCRVIHVRETKQADVVVDHLREDRPDILVLTGHDGLHKDARDIYDMSNYRHSLCFVNAVRRAREFQPDMDDLIIIAGGCQSFFEALIEAGANFASAPKRVLIDALDPLLIAQKLAFTSIYEKISLPEFVKETLKETRTNSDGIGGVETLGKLRLGHPRARCVSGKKKG